MKHKNKVRVLFLTLLVVLVGISFPQLRAAAAEVWNTEPITKLTYQVTINNSQGVTQFDWEATGSNWVAVNAQVPVKGDGSYSFSVELDYVSGMKNLGYISNVSREEEQDIAQLMTVTVNQITVNDKYALIYEVAPVLEPESGNNGISNIWNTAVGEKVCKSDNAYLALDQADGALTLYVKGEEEEFGQASASQKYVEAMGSGWNLGNSFDGFDADLSVEDGGETAWGNPMVTRELIQAVKAKGYKSIRIPMTVYRRYTVNESAGTDEYKYIINPDWLARYKQVVDWAVEEGMYVMVNIHHDSWIWLKDWNGSTDEEAYRMFTDFWKQIATYFASEPEQVCFETINEPQFSDEANAQSLLNAINLSAYNIIRGTAGNETRMIVMPTLNTNHEKGAPLAQLIKELNDEYIIATIHYYSEWVYSANLGKTGFDEELWLDGNGNSYTPRDAADSMMRAIVEQFVSKNIGVIVGEYGLLGYDTSEGCLQTGEELKYYEYMNAIARENKVCLMFWDNGSGIERVDGMYNWKQPLGGNMLEHSMSERSSYATGLDSIYFNHAISEDVNIPLTLNGNSFVEIEGLTEGVDYTYDAVSATVSLKASYVNSLYQNAGYGTMVDLIMKFNAGADWHEYLIKFTAPVISAATGTRSAGITIPVMFNGSKVRRMSAYEGDNRVGPNSSWWSYLQYDSAFHVNYAEGTLSLTSDFFADSSVGNGEMVLKVEYYDGQTVDIVMQIDGDKVNSVAVGKQPEESAEPSEEESTAPTEDEGTEVTVTQDGIQVTLTTDKKEYSQGEKITVSFTVTNTNDFDMTNISLEALIPVGYQLSEDSNETMQLDSLAAGESVTFTVVFVAKKSDTGNHSGQNTGQNSNNPSAGTGDTNYAALWMVLLAAAMLAFEILLLKKRNGKHLFIILFGIAVGGIMLLGASTDVYAAKESKSIAISTVVNMNGNPLSIEAILKYDAVGEDESFDRYAMLNEDVTANEFVQLMGNGINLGNTMEAYGHVSPGIGQSTEIYETLWGQPVTTKEMIRGMKAAGFATIRIPIAWTNAMNFESGDYTIGEDYLNRVDEIINYALDEEMYVIINDHWDGSWWGRFGSASAETRAEAMEMYVSMWTQLAERYGMYGDHLIFEGGNEELGNRLNDTDLCSDGGTLSEDECYATAAQITQKFVDTVRATGGNNSNRFLLIPGYDTDIEKTCDDRYQMPTDSAVSKLLISVHYYTPGGYCLNTSLSSWGTVRDYQEQNDLMLMMKKFADAGYGVVIGEYAVAFDEEGKVKANTGNFIENLLNNCDLYGYCPVLWDCNNLYNKFSMSIIDEGIAELYQQKSYAVQQELSEEAIQTQAKEALDAALERAEENDTSTDISEDTAMAWIMFASGDWALSYRNGDDYNAAFQSDGIVATDVEVTGEGTYTVGLDFTGTWAGNANGIAFSALGIANGETLYPGYVVDIQEVQINGEPFTMLGKSYTTSDNGITTRSNLYNAWVGSIPETARTIDGNLEGVTAVPLLGAESMAIQTLEITFRYCLPEEQTQNSSENAEEAAEISEEASESAEEVAEASKEARESVTE